MELILDSVHDLKHIVDVYSSIVSTISFNCQDDKITLSGIDPSHISLLHVEFDGDRVSSYECSKPVTLTLYSQTLHTILHTANTNDQIMIYTKDDSLEHILIILKNSERVQNYEVPLLTDDSEQMAPTDIDYSTIFKISSKTFYQTCSTLQKINCENIIFENPENTIIIKATSDICTSKTVLTPTEEDEKSNNSIDIIKNEYEIEQEFALPYIGTFSKLHSITDTVSIHVAHHTPLLLQYEFNTGCAQFYIAPKFMED